MKQKCYVYDHRLWIMCHGVSVISAEIIVKNCNI